MFPFPLTLIPYVGDLISGKWHAFFNAIVPWWGAHVLRLAAPVQIIAVTGSGDTTSEWVRASLMLAVAVVGTLVWSVVDSKSRNYDRVDKWFRLCARFWLAHFMFLYGMDKVVPNQMPFPYLTKLVEPYGNFSPMGVLWFSIGASTAYEIFAGCAEVLAGLLLIFPRTALLGAMVALADMTQVFTLNMCYDVPVKLFSFHLIFFSLFLLAPNMQRLAEFFIWKRPVAAKPEPKFGSSPLTNRIVVGLQVVIGLSLLIWQGVYNVQLSKMYGRAVPKPPLYGIWEADDFSLDGQARPALITDGDRWHRLIFQRAGSLTVQRMNSDQFENYKLELDSAKKTLALSKQTDANWKSNLSFEQPAADQLVVTGDFDGHKVQSHLKRVDETKFLLVSRGFHWIQEYPFNR
jgi:hypothetical protein